MIAALRDNAELVRMLLAAGADINARDNHGETPLMHAVERNYTEIIQNAEGCGGEGMIKICPRRIAFMGTVLLLCAMSQRSTARRYRYLRVGAFEC